MLTLKQIKAARALLDWKQEDLARAANLSLPSINNLERGLYSPRIETMQSIKTALEKAGIEFLEENGLRIRNEEYGVDTFTGQDFIQRLDDDIFECLNDNNDEILALSCNEKNWIDYANVNNKRYKEDRDKKGWRERILIPDNSKFITSPPDVYRLLDQTFFSDLTFETYKNRFVIINWSSQRVTMIKSQSIADSFNNNFESLWKISKKLTSAKLKNIDQWEKN